MANPDLFLKINVLIIIHKVEIFLLENHSEYA